MDHTTVLLTALFTNTRILKFKSQLTIGFFTAVNHLGLCSSRAWWPLAPNFSPPATRKSPIFYTNHMLGTLEFTVSEHWAPFNLPYSTALNLNGPLRKQNFTLIGSKGHGL